MKQLVRSKKNRVVAGVCGGIGEYFDVDPNLVRLAFVILTIITSILPGVLIYAVAWLILPEGDGAIEAEYTIKED